MDAEDREAETTVKNVIEFKPKREYVWQHHCGEQVFYLERGGRIQCAQCKEIVDTLIWGELDEDFYRVKSATPAGPVPPLRPVESHDAPYILDTAKKVEWANTYQDPTAIPWRLGDTIWYRPHNDEGLK